MKPRSFIALAIGAAVLTGPGCGPGPDDAPPAPNTLTEQERAEGWRLLFDGATTDGWRGFRSTGMPAGWQAVDGALTRVAEAGYIVTVDTFESFELAFDWRIAPGGNSGVLFRVTEDVELPWHAGPEYQILDNAGHPDGLAPETSAGAAYALHAPYRDATRPPGEWNTARVVVSGDHVEHWLNGENVVEYEIGSDEWRARVATSKFAPFTNFGRVRSGRIALQDHGAEVAFRNIKIRKR